MPPEIEIIDQRMVIAEGIEEFMNNSDSLVDVEIHRNTSGCPVVKFTYGDGEIYNVTITKARNSK